MSEDTMADEDDVIEEEIEDRDAEEPEGDGEPDEHTDPPELTELEELASEYGWAPKDQWRGDEADWVDAKTFMRRTPDAYKKLRKTVENQDRTLAEMNDRVSRMTAAATKAEERAYKRAVADIEARKRAAVEEGDTDAYEAADSELKHLESEQADPETPDDTGNQTAAKALFDTFKSDNPWYGGTSNLDIRKTQRAHELGETVARAGFQGEAFYEKLAELVDEEFSEEPMRQPNKRSARVEGGRTVTRKAPAKQGYKDLPPEAQQVCDEFVAQGVYTKDDGSPMSEAEARKAYAEDYFSEENAA